MTRGPSGAAALAGFLLLSAAPSEGAAARFKDTAGTYLGPVVQSIREVYPDANLIGIQGWTDASGSVLCETSAPAQNGWRFHFHSPAKDDFLLMAECGGYVTGPLKEYLSSTGDVTRSPITGKFLDDDKVLELLRGGGVSFDPVAFQASGKRPFQWTLLRVEDARFKDEPVFWQLRYGAGTWMVNAASRKVVKDVVIRYEKDGGDGAAGPPSRLPSAAGGGAPGGGAAATRPKRAAGYGARTDLDRVLAHARVKLPGALLMGVEGIADAWGGAECLGPSDGWAYYFYWPKNRAIETVFACRGQVVSSQATYIPVDFTYHKELGDTVFADSVAAMDGLLAAEPGLMNEGMGRMFTRKVPMRLFQHRNSPFSSQALWKTTRVWEVEIGGTIYYLDGKTGRFLAQKGKG